MLFGYISIRSWAIDNRHQIIIKKIILEIVKFNTLYKHLNIFKCLLIIITKYNMYWMTGTVRLKTNRQTLNTEVIIIVIISALSWLTHTTQCHTIDKVALILVWAGSKYI